MQCIQILCIYIVLSILNKPAFECVNLQQGIKQKHHNFAASKSHVCHESAKNLTRRIKFRVWLSGPVFEIIRFRIQLPLTVPMSPQPFQCSNGLIQWLPGKAATKWIKLTLFVSCLHPFFLVFVCSFKWLPIGSNCTHQPPSWMALFWDGWQPGGPMWPTHQVEGSFGDKGTFPKFDQQSVLATKN